jgi:CRP-like cAMP-binding protein
MQEMLLSLGQRDAVERTAALLLDLFDRAAARQMVHADTFVIPLAQKHLSAALGISPVHTSRVMNILKTAGMVELGHGKLEVSDRERLVQAAH